MYYIICKNVIGITAMKTMSVSIDDRIYSALKRAAGPRGMSRFIADAVKERLALADKKLVAEYREAALDADRLAAEKDWETTDVDGWD